MKSIEKLREYAEDSICNGWRGFKNILKIADEIEREIAEKYVLLPGDGGLDAGSSLFLERGKHMDFFDVIAFCKTHPGYRIDFKYDDASENIFITLTNSSINENSAVSLRRVIYANPMFEEEFFHRILKMYVEECMVPQIEKFCEENPQYV